MLLLMLQFSLLWWPVTWRGH